jgi:hypothetical protein
MPAPSQRGFGSSPGGWLLVDQRVARRGDTAVEHKAATIARPMT